MKRYLFIFLRILVAVILINTLRYKFTGHEDSIYIFSKIGMEPYGRIGLGIVELVTALFLLIPKTVWLGAVLAVGIMLGAIGMHLSILGIEIKHDGGLLFYTAVFTCIASAVLLFKHREEIPFINLK